MASMDLDADHYRKHSSRQYVNVQSLLNHIGIHSGFSILDVGCGHGKIIAELSRVALYGRSVGVDPSSGMINLAIDLFPKAGYENLDFYQVKAEEMNFPSDCFDLVICANALQWIREPKKAVHLMTKFLKPGGSLAIYSYSKDTPYVRLFEYVLDRYFPELRSHSAVGTMLDVEEHKVILEKCNMTFDVFQTDEVLFSYGSEEEFKDYVKGWLSCYAPIPQEKREDFLEKVVSHSASFNVSTSPSEISVPHESLSIVAKKLKRLSATQSPP